MSDKTLPGIGPSAANVPKSQRETLKAPPDSAPPPSMSDLAATRPMMRAMPPEDAPVDARTAPTARPAPMRPPPQSVETGAVSVTDPTMPPPHPSSGRARIAKKVAGAIEESVRLVRKDPRREDD